MSKSTKIVLHTRFGDYNDEKAFFDNAQELISMEQRIWQKYLTFQLNSIHRPKIVKNVID